MCGREIGDVLICPVFIIKATGLMAIDAEIYLCGTGWTKRKDEQNKHVYKRPQK